MSTSSTVPMLSPDGQVGEVPTDRVPDAVQAGHKIAQYMLSPDGQEGVIPLDQVHAAIAKGFQLKGADPEEPEEPAMPEPSLWDKIMGALGKKGSAVESGGSKLANEVYDVSTPNLAAQIWKMLHGQPNDMEKIPGKAVLAFLAAGGLPESEATEAGEAGSTAEAVPEPNAVRGAVHNAIAETAAKEEPEAFPKELSGDDPANQIMRLTGDDGQTYDVPLSEVEGMEAFKGGEPPLSAEAKAAIQKQLEGKYQVKIVKRGASKGMPKTYRVFDGKRWKTLPSYEAVK